jgi:hypothetical protein
VRSKCAGRAFVPVQHVEALLAAAPLLRVVQTRMTCTVDAASRLLRNAPPFEALRLTEVRVTEVSKRRTICSAWLRTSSRTRGWRAYTWAARRWPRPRRWMRWWMRAWRGASRPSSSDTQI